MKISWYWVVPLACMQTPLSLAEVVVDGSLGGAVQTLPGPNYAIEQSLGQTQGGNLFHSFSQFNINTGESANFQASNSINNIFARVTGGDASLIDGGITSNSTANLWMINPAGWMIGKNAAINLPGSFHLSTATGLDFKDGGQFLAEAGSKSTLSIAEPIDYQFQDAKPATITLDQSNIVMKDGQEISLMGGDIHLQEVHISAPGGRILLASNAGTQGKWQLNDQGLTQTSGQQGTITIEHNQSSSAANPSLSINAPVAVNTGITGSKIQLTAHQITMQNALLSAISRNNSTQTGGDINVQGESINLAHSTFSTRVIGNQAGGNINISGKDLILKGLTDAPLNGSFLNSDTGILSQGKGGAININLSGALRLFAQSSISSSTLGDGTGGNILVQSPVIELNQKSSISIATFLGKGHAGSLALNSDDLSINQGSFLESSSGKESQGNTGDINITSQHIRMDQGVIFSGTDKTSTGEAGNITINTAEQTNLPSDAFLKLQHSIISTTNNRTTQGNGGNISANTGTLVMNNGFIQANSAATNGTGGKVNVNAERTLVSQEQLAVGGNERSNFNLQPTLNVIQAATPNGESGQVNVSPVELNIAGQLAKVDASFANNRPIADDPCSVQRGEATSSLIQTGNGGLAPNASDAVSLPLQRHTNDHTSNQSTSSADTALTVALNTSNPACAKDKR